MATTKFIAALGIAAIVNAASFANETPTKSAIDYVDPFIGTAGKGKTYPGATVPYGMVQLSPDNGRGGWDWISGYFYPDNVIAGFSHTHLSGTGAGDLYDISFMPLTGDPLAKKLDDINKQPTIHSTFSHEKESASPGYYQVYLDTYGINVELTAGLRTGTQRYSFDSKQDAGQVKLDLGYSRNWDATVATELKVIDNQTIAGFRKSTGWAKDQRVFFYTRFSRPFKQWQMQQDGQQFKSRLAQGKNIVGLFDFDLRDNPIVEVTTAISSVSSENARLNLVADGANESFETVKQQARNEWDKVLNPIQIDASEDNKTQFYTALYHSHLAPRVFSDANGEYKGADGETHKVTDHRRFSFFSLWDTFRALHPWKTITDRNRSKEMMLSIMDHYREYGLLPVWNFQGNETDMMMGYHSVPVLVDAYFKGLISIDGNELLNALKKSAMQDNFGVDHYKKMGYVPTDYGKWNVSLTLEYAFDDWAIARLAKHLGQQDDYQLFSERAQNYRNHFDTTTGFMRAKTQLGEFKTPFDPLAYHPEDYCEANAWQYHFFVPHDVKGLIELQGGEQQFSEKLDAIFTTEQAEGKQPEWISGYIGQYVHGNEPAHHVPYLYQYVTQGHKTQQRVRQIMDSLYTTQPDGLCGNEDAGQMSAWYMFSALGFYPLNPASGEYVLGSPEVNSARITLENGNRFDVIANNQSAENVYVSSVTLNGKPIKGFTLSHQQIMAGGKLIFEMSNKPNLN